MKDKIGVMAAIIRIINSLAISPIFFNYIFVTSVHFVTLLSLRSLRSRARDEDKPRRFQTKLLLWFGKASSRLSSLSILLARARNEDKMGNRKTKKNKLEIEREICRFLFFIVFRPFCSRARSMKRVERALGINFHFLGGTINSSLAFNHARRLARDETKVEKLIIERPLTTSQEN